MTANDLGTIFPIYFNSRNRLSAQTGLRFLVVGFAGDGISLYLVLDKVASSGMTLVTLFHRQWHGSADHIRLPINVLYLLILLRAYLVSFPR